jgi:hypothetical protein
MFAKDAQVGLTAAEVRGHLIELETERALAVDTGVAEIGAYLTDLDDEIEYCRRLFVFHAVTEIATLRAELSESPPIES